MQNRMVIIADDGDMQAPAGDNHRNNGPPTDRASEDTHFFGEKQTFRKMNKF